MFKPGAVRWREVATFMSLVFASLALIACGGGSENDCSGGQDVYTNVSYPSSFDLYRVQRGVAVPATAPETPGIPQGCLSSRRFSIESGTLPTGLNFDPATGIISGAPSEEGYFLFIVRVELDGFEGSVSGGVSSRVAVPASYGFASWKTTVHPSGVLLPGNRDEDRSRLDQLGNTLVVLSTTNSGTMTAQVSADDGVNWTVHGAGDSPPNAEGFATGEHGALIYLSGGTPMNNLQDYRAGIWAFDGSVWSSVPVTLPFPARRDHRLVSHGGALYALGGQNASGQLTDVWRSSDGGQTWVRTAASFSSETGKLMCAFALGGKLVALTGHTDAVSGSKPKTRIWESADGATWSEVLVAATSPLKALEPLAQQCVVLSGRAYVLGLFETVSTADLRTWRFEPDPRDSNPVAGGAAVNGKIFVIGSLGTSTPRLSQTVPH